MTSTPSTNRKIESSQEYQAALAHAEEVLQEARRQMPRLPCRQAGKFHRKTGLVFRLKAVDATSIRLAEDIQQVLGVRGIAHSHKRSGKTTSR